MSLKDNVNNERECWLNAAFMILLGKGTNEIAAPALDRRIHTYSYIRFSIVPGLYPELGRSCSVPASPYNSLLVHLRN